MVGGIAQHALGHRIHPQDASLGVEQHESVGGCADNRLEFGVPLAGETL